MEEVRDRLDGFTSVRRLCLTGGEPVIAPKASLLWLLEDRKRAGWWSSIETSGSRIVEELFGAVDFWTVAPKGRSAETFEGDPVEAQLPTLRRHASLPEERRQFKFVIQGEEDALSYRGAIVLQPEHGAGDGRRVFAWWPWDRYPEARLIPQTHKQAGLR